MVVTVKPAAISYTIGNDSQAYGSTANLATDLAATINTGVNGQNLDIAYSSTGDTPRPTSAPTPSPARCPTAPASPATTA